MAQEGVKFDALEVGDAIPSLTLPPVTRHQLALYCGGSGDHNPMHVDLDFAKDFGMPDVFAHGMLSMGFLGRLVNDCVPREDIRKLGTRFVAITWIGDTITASGEVTEKFEAEGEKRLRLAIRCTNQKGEDTLVGEAVVAAH